MTRLPLFVEGGGFFSLIQLINAGTVPQAVTLRALDQESHLIEASSNPVTVTIGAGGSLRAAVGNLFGFEEGSFQMGSVAIDGTQPVAAVAAIGNTPGSSLSILPSVTGGSTKLLFTTREVDREFFDGVALINPNATDAEVSLAFVRNDGATVSRSSIEIPAYWQVTRTLAELMPEVREEGFILAGSTSPIIAVGITGRNDGSTIRNLPIDAAPDDAQVPEQTEFLAVGTVLSGGAALPGTAVTLTGPVSDAIVTDGVGTFTFEEIPAGAYVLTPQATGFTFAPETIALTITDANSRDNDFAGTLIVPEIESITPPSVLFGSPATDIAITGGPFIPSSEVVFDGLPLPTTVIDDGMLGTRLEETLLVLGREGQMLVRNTGPGGDTVSSDPEAFVVGSPAPSISALDGVPEPLIAGNSGFDLTVLGADFLEDASVLVNDVARPTTFIDETELVATIPADDLASGGTLAITAANPSPTVGPSNELLVDVFSQVSRE